MPLHERVAERLRCPDCGGTLRSLEAESALACSGCGARYPVEEGIPRMMVPRESVREDEQR